MGNNIAARQQAPATTRVLSAARDIKIGTVISASDLTTTEVVSVPKGVLVKPESAIGRGALSDIYQGEFIEDSRLATTGSGGGLAATIPPGMRACAVRVDDVVGVSGFATPGMRVDVIISGTPPQSASQSTGTEVRTLLQNIEVLSAGTDIQHDASGPKQVQVVNLLVTPEQAQLLSLASNQAHIQLVLRNPLDSTITPIAGTAMSNIFSGASTPVEPVHRGTNIGGALKNHAYTVIVINGSTRTKQIFTNPEGKE